MGKSSRWVIRGSRLLQHFVVGLNVETNIARSSARRQSGSPPGATEQIPYAGTKNPFENEDDDEDENEGSHRSAHPKNSTNHAYFCGIGNFWRLA